MWFSLANLAGTFVHLCFLYKDLERYRNRKQKVHFLVISNPFFLFCTGTSSVTGVGLSVIREAFLNFKIGLKHRTRLWHNEICNEFQRVPQNYMEPMEQHWISACCKYKEEIFNQKENPQLLCCFYNT